MIAAFLVEFFDPFLSGVTISIKTLVKFLSRKGTEVTVLAPKIANYKEKSSFPVLRVPSIGFGQYSVAWPFLTKGLLREMRTRKAGLIHLQSAYCLGLVGIKLARKLNIPIILTYHTDIVLTLPTFLGKWRWLLGGITEKIAWLFVKDLLRNSAHIIAPSHFVRQSLKKYGVPENKISVIPTAIERPEHVPGKEEARSILELPANKKILLYVGRISKEKNLEMLLRAFAIVHKECPNTVLVIVGGGKYQRTLDKRVKKMGLSKKIYFMGEVPHEKVFSFCSACDVFVFPSAVETQALTPLEAESMGKPVVAVNSGGVPEYVLSSHGFLVENNPYQFANASIRLLNDPKLRETAGKQALLDVQRLLPDRIYPELLEIYNEVLSKHHARERQSEQPVV